MSVSKNGILYVSEEEKQLALQNNSAYDYAVSIGLPLKKKCDRYYEHMEHSSLIFDKVSGRFYWNSRNISGKAIEYIMEVEDKSFVEAVMILSKGIITENHNNKINKLEYKKVNQEKIMILPDKATNSNKVIDYLVNIRKIDIALVNYLIEKQMIYQSVEYPSLKLVGYDSFNNARYVYKNKKASESMLEEVVLRNTKYKQHYSRSYKATVLKKEIIDIEKQNDLFCVNNLIMVGFNKNIPMYANRRSLNKAGKSYKTDITGSSKKYPFVINKNKNSNVLVLCESPLEVISYYEIVSKTNYEDKDAHIISAGGVSCVALDYYLKTHKNIDTICVAFNNDYEHTENAGLNGYKKIYSQYSDKYTVKNYIPYTNDWNDMLIEAKSMGIIK